MSVFFILFFLLLSLISYINYQNYLKYSIRLWLTQFYKLPFYCFYALSSEQAHRRDRLIAFLIMVVYCSGNYSIEFISYYYVIIV